MRSSFSYWLTEFGVKLLTLNLFVLKKILRLNGGNLEKKTVLDIGCGTGTYAHLFPKSNYTGIDIDPGATRYSRAHNPGYEFKTYDATNFKLQKRFDIVLIVGVLHHMDNSNTVKCLSQAKVHLKPSGKLIIVEAISPLNSFNIIGFILRRYDRGKYIRKIDDYVNLVEKRFKVKVFKNIHGGFFDYAYILAS